MTKTEAINHFGSAANVARMLAISRGAVSLWPERLPLLRQYQLAKLSGGALRPDDDATSSNQAKRPAGCGASNTGGCGPALPSAASAVRESGDATTEPGGASRRAA